MVYVKAVLPLSTHVVRSIQEFFEYYSGLTLEEWKENLDDILDEVQGYKQCCTEIVSMHEQIMTPLKVRQDEAKVLVSELKNLTAEFERRQKELEESASTKRAWAIGLAFIPGVNAIATPLLGMSAESDMAEAVAKQQECRINEATIVVVSKTMIPAISAFIDGLNAAAGFFSVVENEIATFQSKGEAAKLNAKKLHYTMMKKKAQEVETSCRAFYAMLPGVRTDLASIPEKADDQNYVDKWLVKKKEEISKKYGGGITGGLRKMITYFSTNDAEQLMIKGN